MRFPARLFFILVTFLTSVVVIFKAPAESRLLFGLFAVSVPLVLATVFTRPYWGILAVTLTSAVWSPSIPLGTLADADLYLHLYLILLMVMGVAVRAIIFRTEFEHDAGHRLQARILGFPMLAVLPTISVLASFVVAPHIGAALKHTMFIGVFFCSYYAAANTFTDWEQVRKFLRVIFIGCALACIAALLVTSRAEKRITGNLHTIPLNNPNALGSYLSIVISLWFALTLKNRRVFKSIALNYAGLGLATACLLLTTSRSSWLGVACAVLFMVYKTRRFRLSLMIFIAIIGLAIVSLSDTDPLVEKVSVEGMGKYSVIYRLKKIELAMNMFAESPLVGQGPGSFYHRAGQSSDLSIQRHRTLECTYPYILAEFGLLGAIAAIWVICLAYRIWRRNRINPLTPARDLSLALGSVMICILVSQIGENTLFFPKTNWIMGFLLGLMAATEYLPRNDNSCKIFVADNHLR